MIEWDKRNLVKIDFIDSEEPLYLTDSSLRIKSLALIVNSTKHCLSSVTDLIELIVLQYNLLSITVIFLNWCRRRKKKCCKFSINIITTLIFSAGYEAWKNLQSSHMEKFIFIASHALHLNCKRQ